MRLTHLLLLTVASCASVHAYAQAHTIAPGRWFACPYKEDIERAAGYLTQGDRHAATQHIVASRCIMLRTGESVYRTEVSILSGLVKVRRPGSTGEYWTFIEAVK